MNNDQKAVELAANIRSMCRDIDNKVETLRKLGYTAVVGKHPNAAMLVLDAVKITEIKL